MAYIEKRKRRDGTYSYRAQIRVKGCPSQAKTFRRKSDAVKWARQIEAAIDERRLVASSSHTSQIKIAALMDDYLDEALLDLSRAGRPIRAQQVAWWRDRIGSVDVLWLQPADVAPHLRSLRREGGPSGRPVSAATCNRYLSALSAVLSWAVRQRTYGLVSNPLRGALLSQREPEGRARFLSTKELERLLQVCRANVDQRLTLMVLLAVSTGMRRSELLRLKWRHVDLDRRLISIERSKNRDRRSVGVGGVAIVELEKRGGPDPRGEDLVFQPLPGQALFSRKVWRRVLSEAALGDFRFHDLRHTAASYLAMNGASPTEIAEILGHRSLAMVKRYTHLTEQHSVKVSQQMADRFLNLG